MLLSTHYVPGTMWDAGYEKMDELWSLPLLEQESREWRDMNGRKLCIYNERLQFYTYKLSCRLEYCDGSKQWVDVDQKFGLF